MRRILSSVLLVLVGAAVYHVVAPEFSAEFPPAGMDAAGGLLQTVKGKQFELMSHERGLYRLDTFTGQTWVLSGNQWEMIEGPVAE